MISFLIIVFAIFLCICHGRIINAAQISPGLQVKCSPFRENTKLPHLHTAIPACQRGGKVEQLIQSYNHLPSFLLLTQA